MRFSLKLPTTFLYAELSLLYTNDLPGYAEVQIYIIAITRQDYFIL